MLLPINKLLSKISMSIKQLNSKFIFNVVIGLFSGIVVLLFLLTATLENKILPNTTISGVNLSMQNRKESIDLLKGRIVIPVNITLYEGDQIFEIPTKSIGLVYDFEKSVDNAMHQNKTKHFFTKLKIKLFSLFNSKAFPLIYRYDKKELDKQLVKISKRIYLKPRYPFVSTSNNVVIYPGQLGKEYDSTKLSNLVVGNIAQANFDPIYLKANSIGRILNKEQQNEALNRAMAFLDKTLVLTHKNKRYEYKGKELIELVLKINGTNVDPVITVYELLTKEINQEMENPVFLFENGQVKEFRAGKDNISINQSKFVEEIKKAFTKIEVEKLDQIEIEIPIDTTNPNLSIGEINNLGIKEQIGHGDSTFRGSISSRMHNIKVASNSLNGTLVRPGEILSFNKILGDVSNLTGYKQAYIIKDGNTVLGDGGGVCQVSTTLFRAVLDAGLPIVERNPHSYRVTYYEQNSPPGFDATVYSPTTDFKFRNDTGKHILIQTDYNSTTASLDIQIYGTLDGRKSYTSKPVITNSTEPPEDLYIDDPTLPVGVVKQIDWKAWGAKVKFDYLVTKNGKKLFEKTFYSNFKPWQAKFLRGTGQAIQ